MCGSQRQPYQSDRGLVHEALFYRGEKQFERGTRSFVEQGLDAGEPVLAALPAPGLELLRDALPGVSDGVQFEDLTVAGRNPSRILPLALIILLLILALFGGLGFAAHFLWFVLIAALVLWVVGSSEALRRVSGGDGGMDVGGASERLPGLQLTCDDRQLFGWRSSVSWRSRRSDLLSRRETCICETPTRSAISV